MPVMSGWGEVYLMGRIAAGRMRRTVEGGSGGFSMIEVLMVLAMMAVVAMFATPPLAGMVRAMRLRSATDTVKNQLLLARIRAVSNPNVHCGVYFDVASGESFVFFDKGTDKYKYDTGDERHGAVQALPLGVSFNVPSTDPITDNAVVFRGDGSAKYGGSIEIKDIDDNIRLVNVLASTGRVRVSIP